MPELSWDRTIADLAERQHGVVARRQLLSLGMSSKAIEVRLRRGSLHRVHRGVYKVGYRRISRRGRWLAAVLACGPPAVLSHGSAGCLHGFLTPGFDRLEVTMPAGPRARRPGIVCHGYDLAPDEFAELDGIPVTSLFRTLLDLAGALERRQLERAWKEVEVRRLTDTVPLAVLLDRHPTKPGAGALRRLAFRAEPVALTRSELEERFLRLLRSGGLPLPRFNASVHLRGRFFELDCLWEPQRLVAELDGGAVHGTDRAFESDRRRDRTLLAEGYRTIRVTWAQLHDEPAQVVADLRSALALYP